MRILVVDDSPGDQQLIARSIRRVLPVAVLEVVGEGSRALELIRRGLGPQRTPPELVLLDLMLPGKSGLEVLLEVKQDPSLSSIPVVVLTSSDAPADVNAAHAARVNGYFIKPVDNYDAVIETVLNFVRGGLFPSTPVEPALLPSQVVANSAEAARALSIVQATSDAIISTDANGNITSLNPGAERLYGIRREQALGQTIDIVVPDERVEELLALLATLRRGDHGRSFETLRVDARGHTRMLELSPSPLTDESGGFAGWVVLGRDITRQKQVEQQFRLALELSPIATLMVDADGQMVLVNREVERMFGYARSELLGQPVEMLVPRQHQGHHPERRHAFLDAPSSRAMGAGRDLYGLCKDGREVAVEIGLNPIHTPEGLFVLSCIVDVSERKQAEEQFRIAVDSSPNGMLMVDSQGCIVLVNRESERMFGYGRGELIGKSIEAIVPRRFREQHPKVREAFLARPESRPMGTGRDLFAMRKDGSEFPVEIGLNPIQTAKGSLVLCAVVDITQRKRAQDELAQQARELARSNAELEQFAYVASHDLQEPLRMVSSFTKLLAEEYSNQLDDTARQYIGFASDGALRMQNLIRDLLAYARLADPAATPSEVEMEHAVKKALEHLELSLADARANVSVGPLPTLLGIPGQLTKLFQNLLENAVKFQSHRTLSLRIQASEHPDSWEFSVTDNGIGIESRHQEAVFQVFRRLHSRDKYPGTGIGLAMCRRIVERHEGRIWLESTPGVGTTVRFQLPKQTQGKPLLDALMRQETGQAMATARALQGKPTP